MIDSNDIHEIGTPRKKPLVPNITAALVECIAIVCHEANRGYCEAQGDYSQVGWNDAPQWQRESARNGVRGVLDGSITNARQSHTSWFKEKLADGWKYGPIKDVDAKTHPCMLDYEDLPKSQQMKDFIFHGIVHSMAKGAVS